METRIKQLGLGILAITAIFISADISSACSRCGLFGNKCRFLAPSHYYHPQAVQYVAQPASVQTFNFVNSFPTPILAQGNSVYGYSLAAQAYSLDPAQVLDRSSRLAELAFSSGQRAIDDFNTTAGTALALSADASRRSQNTLLALSAIQANSSADAPQSMSFRATVTNGKLSLERIEAAPAATAPHCDNCTPSSPPTDDGRLTLKLESNPPQYVTSIATGCGRCHDGSGKNDTPKGLDLSGQSAITNEQYLAAAAAVLSGRMPPKSQISEETKISAVAELAKLRQ